MKYKFEFLTLNYFSLSDQQLINRLMKQSRRALVVKFAKPTYNREQISQVEVGVLKIRTLDKQEFKIFLTSAEAETISEKKINNAYEKMVAFVSSQNLQVIQMEFYHTHPDWNPMLSAGDIKLAEYLRQLNRLQKWNCDLHMISISKLNHVLLMSHAGFSK
jgi:proteasome lid subunit RPN8/RPN11